MTGPSVEVATQLANASALLIGRKMPWFGLWGVRSCGGVDAVYRPFPFVLTGRPRLGRILLRPKAPPTLRSHRRYFMVDSHGAWQHLGGRCRAPRNGAAV